MLKEITFAFRSFLRQPLVAAVIVATLALGLGSNAATFGMIDSLLLRPFTFPGVDRLVVFLSDRVEHEVLPAHAERWAVTAWYYGPGA